MSLPAIEETFKKMRLEYGPFLASVPQQKLNPKKVPADLVPYIPYAALWGISDDCYREEFVNRVPESAKRDLVETVRLIDRQLDKWLAGKEALSFPFSDE